MDESVEFAPQPEIEQPEQPVAAGHLESLAEPPLNQSIYDSGWSIAELMNEIGGRDDG